MLRKALLAAIGGVVMLSAVPAEAYNPYRPHYGYRPYYGPRYVVPPPVYRPRYYGPRYYGPRYAPTCTYRRVWNGWAWVTVRNCW